MKETRSARSRISAELEHIRSVAGGMLRPEDVVTFALDRTTELHNKFLWNDGEAAHRYRLQQAHEIIRVMVVIEPKTRIETRAYVSLSTDRGVRAGYRALVDVMSNEQHLKRLLEDARLELGAFANKYRRLQSLPPMKRMLKAIDRFVGKAA